MIRALEVRHIGKRYGFHRALAKVDLTIRSGELCALLGPNGAGKSTLLGIVSTLVQPTTGSIAYQEEDNTTVAGAALRRRIGVLAHQSFIYGELSALENLRFYARLYGLTHADARCRELLADVGLESDAIDRPARTYSRGMTQRLALARVLLHDPEILLLDEPFTGLDRAGIKRLAAVLDGVRAANRVVVVVTHDLDAVGGITDHVVVLKRGLVQCDERASDTGRGDPFSHAALVELYQQHTDG